MNTDEHGSKRESYLCSSVFIRGSKSVFSRTEGSNEATSSFDFGLLAAMLAAAQSGRPPRVALVNIQDAMLATTDGQNASQDAGRRNSGRARRRSMRTRRPSHRNRTGWTREN